MRFNVYSGIPPYGSREVLCLMGSLSTTDPGDVHESIAACVAAQVTCSVIHVSAEVYVAHKLSQSTGGTFSVVVNKDHYRDLLSSHIPPLPSARNKHGSKTRKWIHMGFAEQQFQLYPTFCAW